MILCLRFLRPFLRVSLDVSLLGPFDPQRPGRDILGDHRAGPSVCVIADVYRGDEHRVRTDSRTFPDLRPVLAKAVVVDGDRSGSDVGPGADLGVADVGQVRDLGPLPDLRALDLDEGARLGPLAQRRARAQVGERAHLAAVGDLALDEVGVRRRHIGAEDRVDQGRVRADDAARPDAGAPAQRGARLDHGVRLDLDVGVDPGRRGVGDRDAGEHVALEDSPAGLGADHGELDAGVDADVHAHVVHLVDEDAPALLPQRPQHVADVVLARGVVGRDPRQPFGEGAPVEREHVRVHLVDRQHLGRNALGVLGLDDALELAVRVADDAAERLGVVAVERDDGGRGAGPAVEVDQAP